LRRVFIIQDDPAGIVRARHSSVRSFHREPFAGSYFCDGSTQAEAASDVDPAHFRSSIRYCWIGGGALQKFGENPGTAAQIGKLESWKAGKLWQSLSFLHSVSNWERTESLPESSFDHAEIGSYIQNQLMNWAMALIL